MAATLAIAITAVALLAGGVLHRMASKLTGTSAGRIALLFGVVLLPLAALGAGTTQAVRASSTTSFCLSCHEMQEHGRSMFLDDSSVLPALHYQKRLVDRDRACYSCHRDYGLYGGLEAKISGLGHMWVHYTGEAPSPLRLRAPFPNANCLGCHDDARGYLEAAPHGGLFDQLHSGDRSCLSCHNAGHAVDRMEGARLWLGTPPEN